MTVEELYREVILDHYRNPRHKGTLAAPAVHAEGNNPSCGDEFAIDLAPRGRRRQRRSHQRAGLLDLTGIRFDDGRCHHGRHYR